MAEYVHRGWTIQTRPHNDVTLRWEAHATGPDGNAMIFRLGLSEEHAQELVKESIDLREGHGSTE